MNRAQCISMVIVILIAVMLFSTVTFCAPKIKLQFMTHTYKTFNDLLTEAIKEFEKENPNISIEYSHVPHGDLDTKIQAMFAAGKGPHMMWQYYPNMIRLAENGYLDVPPKSILDDINKNLMPSTVEQAKYKGKIYGYPCPFAILPVVNVKLYEEAGIAYPTSYPELLAIQQKLTNKAKQQYGVSLSTRGAGGWIQQHWSAVLWGYGEEYLDETMTKAAFNTPGGVQSLKDYKVLAPTDVVPDGFVVGKIATIITGWYNKAYWEENAPHLKFKVLPALRGTKTNKPIANAYYWCWVVNGKKPQEEKEAAWKFIQFITSPKMNVLFDKIGTGVARVDSLAFYKEDPWMRTFLENLQYTRRLPPTPAWPEIQRALDIQIERFLVGEIGAEEALKLAEAEVNKILSR